MRQPLPPAFFLTDTKRVPDPASAVGYLPENVGVIFRHYDHPDRASLCHSVRELCKQSGRLFLVAGDVALTKAVDADGLHVPSWMRRRNLRIGSDRWVISAVHGQRELRWAEQAGVDAALISPVFATTSHIGASGLGLQRFARLAKSTPLPAYALGGINLKNAGRVCQAGAVGIAGIDLFLPPESNST